MVEWTWQAVDELSPQQIADLLNQYELLKSGEFDGPGPKCDHDVVLLYRCDLCDEEIERLREALEFYASDVEWAKFARIEGDDIDLEGKNQPWHLVNRWDEPWARAKAALEE